MVDEDANRYTFDINVYLFWEGTAKVTPEAFERFYRS